MSAPPGDGLHLPAPCALAIMCFVSKTFRMSPSLLFVDSRKLGAIAMPEMGATDSDDVHAVLSMQRTGPIVLPSAPG